MKKMKVILMGVFLVSTYTFAENDHDHSSHENHKEEASKAIGKGKAIEEVNVDKGFKLADAAIKTIKIKTQKLDSQILKIFQGTLVSTKDFNGVYIYRNGFFKLIKVDVLNKDKTGYKIKIEEFKAGDQIVTNGADLLNVADVFSKDNSEYGHSH